MSDYLESDNDLIKIKLALGNSFDFYAYLSHKSISSIEEKERGCKIICRSGKVHEVLNSKKEIEELIKEKTL